MYNNKYSEMWTFYTPCVSVAVSGDFCHETAQKVQFAIHGKLSPWLTGLPYLADRATRLGRSPHLSRRRDQSKIRNYMDRWVTPPTWVTSPAWGPCKQALIVITFCKKRLSCDRVIRSGLLAIWVHKHAGEHMVSVNNCCLQLSNSFFW